MAEERMIELGIISASNLKDVNYISKMETYAVLSFPPYVEYTTQVDYKGGLNPHWEEKLGFLVPEHVIRRGDGHLKVEIFTLSTLGPKFVCEASIPLSDISMLCQLNSTDTVYKKYILKTNSGDYHGDLNVSFALGEKVILQKGERHDYPIVARPSTPPTYDIEKPSYPSPTSKPSRVKFDLGPSFTSTKPLKLDKPSRYDDGDSYDTHAKPSSLQTTNNFSEPLSIPISNRTPTTPPPSRFGTSPPSTFTPFPSKPTKPIPLSYVPSKPHPLREDYETFPPSYVDPISSKPLRPLPQPIAPGAFKQSLPFEKNGYGHVDDYPIKVGNVPPKFGKPSVSDRMDFGTLEQNGYGHGVDYTMKPPKFGASRTDVPISQVDGYGPTSKYGYEVPTTYNLLFGTPIGKVLLVELSRSMNYDHRY